MAALATFSKTSDFNSTFWAVIDQFGKSKKYFFQNRLEAQKNYFETTKSKIELRINLDLKKFMVRPEKF